MCNRRRGRRSRLLKIFKTKRLLTKDRKPLWVAFLNERTSTVAFRNVVYGYNIVPHKPDEFVDPFNAWKATKDEYVEFFSFSPFEKGRGKPAQFHHALIIEFCFVVYLPRHSRIES